MFGYVTVAKNQLTEDEYKTFCAYYCGVCRAIGRKTSHTARLGLSYDITFLALVLSSLSEEGGAEDFRCAVHPLKKRGFINGDRAVEYAASAGVILQYLKLADDWHDDRSVKALAAMTVFRRGYKKAAGEYPALLSHIKEQLKELGRLESENSSDIDAAADCFAKILARLFIPDFITGNNERRILEWFGYNLGRWIYIIDAFNDLEDDLRSGAYNPFVSAGIESKKDGAESIELSLTYTLGNIASAFELLELKRNESIVGKMIYTSLKQKQRCILSGCGGRERKDNGSI